MELCSMSPADGHRTNAKTRYVLRGYSTSVNPLTLPPPRAPKQELVPNRVLFPLSRISSDDERAATTATATAKRARENKRGSGAHERLRIERERKGWEVRTYVHAAQANR